MIEPPSRAELVSMISRIMSAEGSEIELDDLLFQLKEISSLPDVSDLIFYSEEDLSAEEVADRILSYQPPALE